MGFQISDLYFLMKQNREFWVEAINILRKRNFFDRTAWSLSLLHG